MISCFAIVFMIFSSWLQEEKQRRYDIYHRTMMELKFSLTIILQPISFKDYRDFMDCFIFLNLNLEQ